MRGQTSGRSSTACDVRVDGGWGWVIVAGCALSTMLMAGIIRAFGIFFTALVEEFHGSASLTAFAFGLFLCMHTLTAPIAVYLGDRFSERILVMTGATILCSSFGLIFLAPNLAYVIVFIGITGIGNACVIACYITVIGKYFKERSSLASMLSFAGSSVGHITLPHLILYLLREYGLRGMIMLYGGILFHIAICGSLIRPIPKDNNNSITSNENMVQLPPREKEKSNTLKGMELDAELEPCLTRGSGMCLDKKSDDIEIGCKKRRKTSIGPQESEMTNSMSSVRSLDPTPSSAASAVELPIVTPQQFKSFNIKAVFRKIFDPTLLKDVRFILFLLASGLAVAGFQSQITYLVPWCIEKGHSIDSAALLLSISGGAEILGRITMGFLGDSRQIGPVKVMIIYTAIIGTGNLLMAFASAYVGMVAYAVAFGLWGSGGHLFIVPIVCSFFEREKVPSAVGLNILVMGFGMTVANSAMGLIKDNTGSFRGIFFVCASVQWLSCGLMIITLCLHRRKQRGSRLDDDEIPEPTSESPETVIKN